MDANRAAMCAIFAVGTLLVLAIALNETSGKSTPVPRYQGEKQVMGMAVDPAMPVTANVTEIQEPEVHFWAPGFPGSNNGEPCIPTPHRYPAIPGGNITNVMHRGWASVTDNSPASEWFFNPPEAAVT